MLARVELGFGRTKIPVSQRKVSASSTSPVRPPGQSTGPTPGSDDPRAQALRRFCQRLAAVGLNNTYEAAHAQLALRCFDVVRLRQAGLAASTIKPLPEPAEGAAERLYADSAGKTWLGLSMLMESYATSKDDLKRRLWALWKSVSSTHTEENQRP